MKRIFTKAMLAPILLATCTLNAETYTVDSTATIPGSVLTLDLALGMAYSDSISGGGGESTILLAPGVQLSVAGVANSPVEIKPLLPETRAALIGPVVFWSGAAGSSLTDINLSLPPAGGSHVLALADVNIDGCVFDGSGIEQTVSGGAIKSHANLVLSGCTIENYDVDGDGAGLLIYSGHADIDDVLFRNNQADGDGGGMILLYGGADVRDTIFRNNASDGDGAGLMALHGEITIEDSVFRNNSAGGDGGGLAAETTTHVSDSIFNGNDATRGGGAFLASQGDADDCLFKYNTASSDGGGLWGAGSEHVESVNCTYSSNTADARGGGAFLADGAALRGGSLDRNQGGAGGGAAIVGSDVLLSGDIHFERNTADTHGGGLLVLGRSHSITDVRFELNTSNGLGGGIHLGATDTLFDSLVLHDNRAYGSGGGASGAPDSSARWHDCDFTKNFTHMHGGGLSTTGRTAEFDACFFQNNQAADDGGGLHASGLESLTLEDTSFEANCSIQSNGGGMHAMVDAFAMHEGTFVRNHCSGTDEAPGEGGGLWGTWADGTISSVTFVDHDIAGSGAGARLKDAPTTLTGCAFRYNTCELEGGGLLATGTVPMELNDCEFYTNNTLGEGGGVKFNGPTVQLGDSSFVYNGAEYGGAICGRSVNATLSNDNFLGNSALDGGAIFTSQSQTTAMNMSFNSNFAQRHGGAIAALGGGSLDIGQSYFLGGGANDNGGGVYAVSTPIRIHDTTLYQVHAGLYGGGLYMMAAPTVLETVSVTSCNAEMGGGIAATGDMTGELTDVSVRACTAVRDGGGLYFYAGAYLDATSSTIAWCVAGRDLDHVAHGGGILAHSSSRLVNVIVAHNAAIHGTGGGIHAAGQTDIHASTISHNEALEVGGIHAMGGSLTNSICWGNMGDDLVGLSPAFSCIEGGVGLGEGVIDEMPMFIDPDIEDFRLSEGSLLIDAGDEFLLPSDSHDLDMDDDIEEQVPFDHAGTSRVIGDQVDMGAREFGSTSSCPGDLNGDHEVGIIDLLLLLSAWGSADPCPEDLDGDGIVGILDLLTMIEHWGGCDD